MPRPTVVANNIIGSTDTLTLSPPSGTDFLAAYALGDPAPSLTWRSNAMDSIRTQSVPFGLVARLARTLTIGGTSSGTVGGADANMWVLAMEGVDQTTPIASDNASTATGTDISISLSPSADQRVLYAVLWDNGSGITLSAGSDNTVHAQVNENYFGVAVGTSIGNITATLSGSRQWWVLYAIVNGASAGADTLTIDSQPSTATSGVAMGNVVVESSDTASTATVTATIASGSGSLSGTTSVAMVAGVATFSNLIITGSGSHTLAFNATEHDEVVSSTITVSEPPAPPRVLISFRPPA